MRRVAMLVLAAGLVLMASPALGLLPEVAVSPASGAPGSSPAITITGFTANSTFEVHAGDFDGTLLGSGTTTTEGAALLTITIPAGSPPGSLTLAVCETQFVACTDTGNEFWIGGTTTFTVTAPDTTATTGTTAPPDTTGTTTVVPTPAACSIPAGAIVIDFDEWDASLGTSGDVDGEFQTAFREAGYFLWFNQWAEYGLTVDPPTTGEPAYLNSRTYDSTAVIANNPSRDLTTSSPPMVMRLFDDTHWTYIAGIWDAFIPDYFGFNVGFGHFSEGFEHPEKVVVELRVTAMPMNMPDGSVLDQGAWESVSVTLGPGPQPVTTCIEIRNTLGDLHPYTAFWIDILPRTESGAPIHVPLDIDDFYYGTVEPPPIIFDLAPEDIPVIDTVPVTVPLPVPPAAEDPAGVPWWWIGVAAIAGLGLGAVLTGMRARRST